MLLYIIFCKIVLKLQYTKHRGQNNKNQKTIANLMEKSYVFNLRQLYTYLEITQTEMVNSTDAKRKKIDTLFPIIKATCHLIQ